LKASQVKKQTYEQACPDIVVWLCMRRKERLALMLFQCFSKQKQVPSGLLFIDFDRDVNGDENYSKD